MGNATLGVVTRETAFREFDDLYREHYRLIYRTALAITGKSEDADDVLQTIFLRLLRRDFPPDLKKNPRAYLYRAAVNASLNTMRVKKRQSQFQDVDAIQSIYPSHDSSSDTHARLVAAISQLNAKSIEILMLRYVHSFSDVQIAKMLGTSRGSIAVTLFRVRRQLKKLMRAQGENL